MQSRDDLSGGPGIDGRDSCKSDMPGLAAPGDLHLLLITFAANEPSDQETKHENENRRGSFT